MKPSRFYIALVALTACSTDPAETAKSQSSGAAAMDYLLTQEYPTTTIQVGLPNGLNASKTTRKTTFDALADLTGRSADSFNAITVDITTDLNADSISTLDDVKAYEDAHRTAYTDGATSVIWMGYMPGSMARDTMDSYTLALAYRGSSIMVFPDNIRKSCESFAETLPDGADPAKACAYIEATTVLHELGHLMGLTDNGIAMVEPHKDEGNGDHCDRSDCIMYAFNNMQSLFERARADLEAGREIALFDANCTADVQAAIRGAE